jgi:hypothetical protein
MSHRQIGKRRRVSGFSGFACASLFGFLFGNPFGPASAGDLDRSTLPAPVAGPTRCDIGVEGVSVIKDSGDCKRISGYIAAGALSGKGELILGHPSRFGRLKAPEFVGGARSSGATVIDAPAGQDRFFLPSGPEDEAR